MKHTPPPKAQQLKSKFTIVLLAVSLFAGCSSEHPTPASKDKEAAKPFKDRQLDMALDYLRGQIKANAAAVPMKKAG